MIVYMCAYGGGVSRRIFHTYQSISWQASLCAYSHHRVVMFDSPGNGVLTRSLKHAKTVVSVSTQ